MTGLVGLLRRLQDRLDLLHVVHVERGDGVAVFRRVIEQLPRRDERHVSSCRSRGAGRYAARRLRSMSCRIIGVRMSCIATAIFPPGTTMLFARDMNASCSMVSR